MAWAKIWVEIGDGASISLKRLKEMHSDTDWGYRYFEVARCGFLFAVVQKQGIIPVVLSLWCFVKIYAFRPLFFVTIQKFQGKNIQKGGEKSELPLNIFHCGSKKGWKKEAKKEHRI